MRQLCKFWNKSALVLCFRNKRKIMRIFSVPPSEETLSEPNFYDTMSKIRLRQQLEMHSICKYGLCRAVWWHVLNRSIELSWQKVIKHGCLWKLKPFSDTARQVYLEVIAFKALAFLLPEAFYNLERWSYSYKFCRNRDYNHDLIPPFLPLLIPPPLYFSFGMTLKWSNSRTPK